jgi:hypothetical protein
MSGEHPLLTRFTAWSESRRGQLLLFLWAVAEGCAWPVVPDPLLGLMGASSPRRAPLLYATVVAGGLLGTLLLWPVALAAPAALHDFLALLPVVDAPMIAAAQERVAGHGLGDIAQFGGGTPLKAWAWAWATTGGGLLPFLGAAVVNRLTRILPFFALTTIGARLGGDRVRRHGRTVAAGYLLFWLLFYLDYWSIIGG